MTKEDEAGFKNSLAQAIAPQANTVKVKCPTCKAEVEFQPADLSYHKEGRSAKCPKCKRVMILRRFVKRG